MANGKNGQPKEQMVTIKLPKTRELKDDVFVSINNRNWLIQRGVAVEVPACVAEVLKNSEDMAEEALRFDQKVQKPTEK